MDSRTIRFTVAICNHKALYKPVELAISRLWVWEPLELAEPWHMSMARKRGLGSAFAHK